MRFWRYSLLLALCLVPQPVPAWKGDIVRSWARKLGNELWQLSESLTKSDQIRSKYKQMNASVKQKDGKQILESSLQSVSKMLTRKINAVKCIHATAVRLASDFNYTILEDKKNLEFKYCSSKYSTFVGEYNPVRLPDLPKFAENNENYMNVSLERDSHFYDISVNTNLSCVHVPTNIYYKENEALGAILWSEKLTEVFTKNYQSDPSLSWQYFGSSHGIMRFYPGMPWNRKKTDEYDCRVRSWYIEAATCSKDVIILFDVSGSMTGFKNYVARRTLNSILDTLSNNDYVNVYTFKKDTNETIKCFVDLVQATPENLATITYALQPKNKKHKVPLEGNANLTQAYIKAFKTLKDRRNCNVSSPQGCNQLVMLITDYVPGNLTEVFDEHNREVIDGVTYIPVRVFTYLIGKEVTNVAEIQWMACSNRGYYVHIHSIEEVQQQVLKYINVIARPMILQKDEPPPTWTHANIDETRTTTWDVSHDIEMPDEDKLVTSVAIPAFDTVYNTDKNDAILLGVAGTDVPIDSIAKLAQPHQLGVNGYSFIVSNNGYLLLHPLLITSINGALQKNYNSVDFVEVEQVDDGKGPRELGEKIKTLRENLVNGVDGNLREVEVLYHYDSMRRIARVKHDYFFNKLEGTPFSMGISLPTRYGDTELLLKDNPLEVKEGQGLTGINVTDYFRFSYRVHRDWVYCKYHYLEGHESENAEIELWKFLALISKDEVDITIQQYTEEMQTDKFHVDTHCGNRTQLGKDSYYCTEDLVKQLVFDAKLSSPFFRTWNATEAEVAMAKAYNVSIRFIATSSGLTRWHYIFDDTKNEVVNDHGYTEKNYTGEVFGDKYRLAIEETWYQAAVLQHMTNKESLVIGTPLYILDKSIKKHPTVINEDGDIIITASYAIFYKDGKSETPASVVGFQFWFKSFVEKFLKITNTTSGEENLSCDSDQYDCFLVDSSGYIIVSNDVRNVGVFFGVKQPYVLKSFIDKGIFDHVEVFNYQALCSPSILMQEVNSGWSLSTPLNIATKIFQWILTEAFIFLSNIYNWNDGAYAYPGNDEVIDYPDLINTVADAEPTTTIPPPLENETSTPKENEEIMFSCDHSISLYILNQTYFLETMALPPVVFEDDAGECHPPYWAAHVVKTNMLLVVVEKGDWDFTDCPKPNTTEPVPTNNSIQSREPCHKLDLGMLMRRRLEGCYTYHEEERNITACGKGFVQLPSTITLLTSLLSLLTTFAFMENI